MERPSTPEIFETMIIHFAEGDYRKFSDSGIQTRISKAQPSDILRVFRVVLCQIQSVL